MTFSPLLMSIRSSVMGNNRSFIISSNMIKVCSNTIKVFFAVILFRILLDISYYYIISPLYAYVGFVLDVDENKIIETYIILFLLLLYLPKKSEKVSNAILQLLILMAYIPVQTYYSLSNIDKAWFYSLTFFWFVVITLNKIKLKFWCRSPKGGKLLVYICSFWFVLLSFVLIYLYLGLSIYLDLTDLIKLHEIRAKYVAISIPLFAYIINWTGWIILPLTALIALFARGKKKSYFVLVVVICCELVLFSSGAIKSYLFAIPAVIWFAWILSDEEKTVIKICSCFSASIMLGMLVFWIYDSYYLTSFLTRRVFFVPARVSYCYYDFFRDAPIYLSSSRLEFLFDYHYNYSLDPASLIGDEYFGYGTSANTGIAGDGYMRFGYIGLGLWAILLAIMLKFADAVSAHKSHRIVWPVLMLVFYSLVNCAPLTALLTHGILFALLLAFLFPRTKKKGSCIYDC